MSFTAQRSGKGFRILETRWVNGIRARQAVPFLAYAALGFNKAMTLDEAKEHAKRLNLQKQLNKREQVGAARQVVKEQLKASAYLIKPEAFEAHLLETSAVADEYKRSLVCRWNAVQKLVVELGISPQDYAKKAASIYKYFQTNKYSLDYAQKLLRVLNQYGAFILEHYVAVPAPKREFKQRIRDAYMDSDSFVGESDPLTPAMLNTLKNKLTVPGQYEWLFTSIWYGLRPSELDSLHNQKNFRVTFDVEANVQVLWVYQSKLGAIEKEKRWKLIPVLYPEQRLALEMIRAKKLVRPLLKTLRALTPGHVTLYGGRKGFESIMSERGHPITDISAWLGHQSIEMTWRKYRNRKKVALSRTG